MNDNIIDFQMCLLKRQHRKQLGMNEFEYNVLMGTMKWLLHCMPPSAKLHARELSIQSSIQDLYGMDSKAFYHAVDHMYRHFHLPEHSMNRASLIENFQTVGDVAKYMEICILKA
ncbi:hypothetical protein [Gracilibacillus sp. Marseille-QA3620]